MPSPIGHSLIGYVISLFKSQTLLNKSTPTVILFIFVANAPDLDFIPGLIVGKPNLYHHGISHSIGVGILFSVCLTLVLNFKKPQNINRDFPVFFSLYGSHLLLDYLSFDGRPPIGIPIFWPMSNKYFIFSNPLFPPISHSKLDDANLDLFLSDVFSIQNLYVVFWEVIAVLPIFLIILLLKRHYKKVKFKID